MNLNQVFNDFEIMESIVLIFFVLYFQHKHNIKQYNQNIFEEIWNFIGVYIYRIRRVPIFTSMRQYQLQVKSVGGRHNNNMKEFVTDHWFRNSSKSLVNWVHWKKMQRQTWPTCVYSRILVQIESSILLGTRVQHATNQQNWQEQ